MFVFIITRCYNISIEREREIQDNDKNKNFKQD